MAGSVVVTFELRPGTGAGEPTPGELYASLQEHLAPTAEDAEGDSQLTLAGSPVVGLTTREEHAQVISDSDTDTGEDDQGPRCKSHPVLLWVCSVCLKERLVDDNGDPREDPQSLLKSLKPPTERRMVAGGNGRHQRLKTLIGRRFPIYL